MADFLKKLSEMKLGTVAEFNGKKYINVTNVVIECLDDNKLFVRCLDF